jgi:hypothetical protein
MILPSRRLWNCATVAVMVYGTNPPVVGVGQSEKQILVLFFSRINVKVSDTIRKA